MRRRDALAAAVTGPVLASILVFAAPAHAAPKAKTSYTVLIERGASHAAALAAVVSAGGTVVEENAAIGTLTVRAPAAGFARRVSASSAVYGAARVRPIGRFPRPGPVRGAVAGIPATWWRPSMPRARRPARGAPRPPRRSGSTPSTPACGA